MEGQQDRGRSPSIGRHSNLNISHPSSSPHYSDQSQRLVLDPSLGSSTFSSGAQNSETPSTTAAEQYNFSSAYLNSSPHSASFTQPTVPSNDFPDHGLGSSFKQRNSISNGSQRPSQLNLQNSNHQFSTDFGDVDVPTGFIDSFPAQDLQAKQDQDFNNVFMLDPSLEAGEPAQNQSINPADIMSTMSASQGHIPTPPNLMHMDSRPSPRQSPSMQHDQFYSPGHSRNASLDPSSAGFTHGQQQADWTGMLGGASFQQHRRAPSEHSDVSSSVAPSPFLAQQDSFEAFNQGHSPMLNPQQDNSLYQESLGIERFSLSDAQQQHQHQQQQRRPNMSPGHSPYVSPRMSPRQGLGISQESQFILPSNDLNGQFGAGPGPQIFTGSGEPGFQSFPMQHDSSDMGQAAQMAPPEINVELAPPSRQQNFEPTRTENDLDALSPPERGMSFPAH